jgi:hypothetical protein
MISLLGVRCNMCSCTVSFLVKALLLPTLDLPPGSAASILMSLNYDFIGFGSFGLPFLVLGRFSLYIDASCGETLDC